MSDLPFGFSSSGDGDDDRDKNSGDKNKPGDNPGGNPFGGANPFGFGGGQGFGGGPGGDFDPSKFDPNMIGQMFSQLGNMFSGMGAGMAGGGNGPVNYSVATNLARQQIGSFTPILEKEISASADAVRLADVWLDDATNFPSGVTQTVAWTPVQWLEESMDTWKGLCDPVAEQLARTW